MRHVRAEGYDGIVPRTLSFTVLAAAMLPACAVDKLFQWDLEFSPARKPGAVNAVPRPIDIATPDPFKTEQNIALQLWSDLL